MADHIALLEPHHADAFEAADHAEALGEPAHPARREVVLGEVAGDHRAGAVAHPREEHLHLLGGGVLGLVEDDEGVVQGAAAHERERGDLDDAALPEALRLLQVHQVVERVVERAEVGVHLLDEVAGEEAQFLAGLDRRAGEDDPAHRLAVEGLDRDRHGEPGLPGARRADAEHQVVRPERADVLQLAEAAGADRLPRRGGDDRVHEVLAERGAGVLAEDADGGADIGHPVPLAGLPVEGGEPVERGGEERDPVLRAFRQQHLAAARQREAEGVLQRAEVPVADPEEGEPAPAGNGDARHGGGAHRRRTAVAARIGRRIRGAGTRLRSRPIHPPVRPGTCRGRRSTAAPRRSPSRRDRRRGCAPPAPGRRGRSSG